MCKECINAEITIMEKDETILSFFIKDNIDTYETVKSLCGQISKLIACEALGDGEYYGTVVFSEGEPDGSEECIDSDEFSIDVVGSFVEFKS